MALANSYVCRSCKKRHKFPAWVHAHWFMEVSHTCDCGAVTYLKEGCVTRTEPPKQKNKEAIKG